MAKTDFETALEGYEAGDNGSAGVVPLLKALQIPVPEKTEFIFGQSGVKFPHHKAGLVISLEVNKDCIEHPLVTPAVAQVNARNFRFELSFGGRTAGMNNGHAKWVHDQLQKSGITTCDPRVDNTMAIPLPTNDFPDGLPIRLDRDHLKMSLLHKTGQSVARIFNRQKSAPKLEDYGVTPSHAQAWRQMHDDLQGQFNLAVAGSILEPNQAELKKFWSMAEMMTADSFRPGQIALFRGWDEYPAIEPKIVANFYNRPAVQGGKPNHFAYAGQHYRNRLTQ